MKVCPHCHKDLPDDSTFCIYCGKPLKKVSMKERSGFKARGFRKSKREDFKTKRNGKK